MAEKLEELIKSWMRLCRDPRTPVELLEKAAYWESINTPDQYELRLAVAKHRSSPADLLAMLSMCKNLAIQIAVAGHGNLSEAVAGKLLRSRLRQLRRTLAANPRIPFFAMEKLSRDYEDVRASLARNPSLKPSIMARLARERSLKVRQAVAGNSGIPQALLEKLSRDKDASVRLLVARHPHTPFQGLKALASDADSDVRQEVFERAMEEYPTEKAIFQALSSFPNSVLAQEARKYLEQMEQQEAQRQERLKNQGLKNGTVDPSYEPCG